MINRWLDIGQCEPWLIALVNQSADPTYEMWGAALGAGLVLRFAPTRLALFDRDGEDPLSSEIDEWAEIIHLPRYLDTPLIEKISEIRGLINDVLVRFDADKLIQALHLRDNIACVERLRILERHRLHQWSEPLNEFDGWLFRALGGLPLVHDHRLELVDRYYVDAWWAHVPQSGETK